MNQTLKLAKFGWPHGTIKILKLLLRSTPARHTTFKSTGRLI